MTAEKPKWLERLYETRDVRRAMVQWAENSPFCSTYKTKLTMTLEAGAGFAVSPFGGVRQIREMEIV